jgi:hypothetical protein
VSDHDHFSDFIHQDAVKVWQDVGVRMGEMLAEMMDNRISGAAFRERKQTGEGAAVSTAPATRPPVTQKMPTNHDAAPAAKAPTDASPLRSAQSVTAGMGTGDTQEPVAWAVVYPNDEVGVIAFRMADANERATASDRVVPLYREPQTCPYVVGRTTLHCSLTPFTLTDAEREAIACAAESYADNDDDEDCHRVAVTLGRLLERTK